MTGRHALVEDAMDYVGMLWSDHAVYDDDEQSGDSYIVDPGPVIEDIRGHLRGTGSEEEMIEFNAYGAAVLVAAKLSGRDDFLSPVGLFGPRLDENGLLGLDEVRGLSASEVLSVEEAVSLQGEVVSALVGLRARGLSPEMLMRVQLLERVLMRVTCERSVSRVVPRPR